MNVLDPYTANVMTVILALALITAAIAYTFLDGHDLGIGHISLFVKSQHRRNMMIKSVLPYWDGNETWLVLAVGGLFAVFPYAYSYYLIVGYIPAILLLISLGFRGVCFEFRMKASEKSLPLWDKVFGVASMCMSFFGGMFVGIIMKGIQTNADYTLAQDFSSMLHLTPVLVGIMFILLHSNVSIGWMSYKLERDTARELINIERYFVYLFPLSVLAVVISVYYEYTELTAYVLLRGVEVIILPILLLSALIPVFIYEYMVKAKDNSLNCLLYLFTPLLSVVGVFVALAISMWPMIVFPGISIYDAALEGRSLLWSFTVVLIFVPLILGYTVLVHIMFRGKIKDPDHTRY